MNTERFEIKFNKLPEYLKKEVIDFIEDQGLGFNLGNAVKYAARAEHKGSDVEDLQKAIWYLTREVARRDGTLITTTQRNFGNAVISEPAT